MKDHYDIAVIGAGPAGMSAASLAADHGASVVLFDEQPRLGGQIYRDITRQRAADTAILGAQYYHGKILAKRLAASAVEHISSASVWHVSAEQEIGVTVDDEVAHLITADHIIIATGAQERPFPVPGWTFPGVMNVGAAQILLKSSGILLPNPVFVGTGPLLYLIAHQYLRAGGKIAGLLDTTPRSNLRAAVRHLPAAYGQAEQLWKGWRWLRDLRKSGIPFIRAVEDVRIIGTKLAEGIEYKANGSWQHLATETVLLHQGVVPNVNLAMAAGCAHQWNDTQLCWHAEVDKLGHSSVEGVSIAGDGAGITGADGAETLGALAAIGALTRLAKIDRNACIKLARPLHRIQSRRAPFRRFLDTLYQPAAQFRLPVDDTTLVCRCEEVTAGDIRAAIRLGCSGPNQLKSFTRAGMGPCQARLCGLTVSAMIADELNQPVAQVGAGRLRAPVKPLELAHLAALCDPE
jgi:NADPH-dependent 2,4-dienoyl-CoA reductase/sulfur reductase-like enzyme